MPQDLISNAMNCLMNAKRSGKTKISVPYSKVLLNVLGIIKEASYLKKVEVEGNRVIVELDEMNECRSIKPRYYVKKNEFEKFVRRFLPARDFGIIIVSTSKGLMTHKDAIEKGIGGSLIAYIF